MPASTAEWNSAVPIIANGTSSPFTKNSYISYLQLSYDVTCSRYYSGVVDNAYSIIILLTFQPLSSNQCFAVKDLITNQGVSIGLFTRLLKNDVKKCSVLSRKNLNSLKSCSTHLKKRLRIIPHILGKLSQNSTKWYEFPYKIEVTLKLYSAPTVNKICEKNVLNWTFPVLKFKIMVCCLYFCTYKYNYTKLLIKMFFNPWNTYYFLRIYYF